MSVNAMLRVGVTSAALAMLLVSPTTAATRGDNPAKLHRRHHERTHDAAYRSHRIMEGDRLAYRTALPYGPRYGFLPAVPPNAIRMPGYTFVPGVGILGESCDLPTSACSNRYRDVQ
jgi:hypothetical protein